MRLVGVHWPGTSVMHRTPAGVKMLGLMIAITVVLWWRATWVAPTAMVAALLLLVSTRVPWSWIARPARMVALLVVVLTVLQVWLVGWQPALQGGARLTTSLVLAWTVSLTTPVSEVLGVLQRALRPLRGIGVNPDQVALTITLAIRSIPWVLSAIDQADQARLARGQKRSVRALVVPTVVRTIRMADAVGEALVARGVGGRQHRPTEPGPGAEVHGAEPT